MLKASEGRTRMAVFDWLIANLLLAKIEFIVTNDDGTEERMIANPALLEWLTEKRREWVVMHGDEYDE